MKKIRYWIISHQVAAFFIITFIITWPGFFLTFFIFPGNQYIEALVAPVVFSPAIASILIIQISDTKPKQKKTKQWWIAFFITWFLSAVIQMLNFRIVNGVDFSNYETRIVLLIFSGIFAFFPAMVVSCAYARSSNLRNQFSTLFKPRGHWFWYLLIFLIFPGVLLLDYAISPLLGIEMVFYLNELSFSGAILYLLIDFLRGFLFTGGINEESGWRGFALPKLQAKYPVIVSIVIVWFFWAAWHIPYDLGLGVEMKWMIENRLLWNLVFSILFSWVYNRTEGSLLAPALFHPAMNTFGNHFSKGTISKYIFIGLAIFAVIYDRMWKKLPSDHSAVH